jgi:cyanophycin synthetase
MVEAHAYGDDYRLMVFGGKLVAAIRREPPAVIGDGQSNIADLMLKFNQRRSQNMVASNYLRPVHLDQTVLAHLTGQGLSVESVPPPGNRVTLRSNANLSTGGTCTDVTADTHPDVRAMAEAFGMTLGFGALGLDYITTDISRPFASGDSFIEANTTPGLDAAIAAGISAETIGTTLLGSSSRRIPAVLLLIADDTFFEVLATFKAEMLNHPGMAWLCGEEAGIAGLPLNVAHQPVWQRIPVLLKNRSAAALIAVWSLSDLIKHGAPLDRFDIVLNGGELTIPAQWQTVLARLSSRPVRVATKDSIMKEALMAVAAAGESHCDDAMNRSR